MKIYVSFVVVAVILGLFIGKCLKDKQVFYRFLKYTILDAEKFFQSGEGKDKLKYTFNVVKANLPSSLRLFFTDTLITRIIEEVVGGFQPAFKGFRKITDKDKGIQLEVNRVFENRSSVTEIFAEGSTNLKDDHRISVGIKHRI